MQTSTLLDRVSKRDVDEARNLDHPILEEIHLQGCNLSKGAIQILCQKFAFLHICENMPEE